MRACNSISLNYKKYIKFSQIYAVYHDNIDQVVG